MSKEQERVCCESSRGMYLTNRETEHRLMTNKYSLSRISIYLET